VWKKNEEIARKICCLPINIVKIVFEGYLRVFAVLIGHAFFANVIPKPNVLFYQIHQKT
jgi:hypothetical protein